MRAFVAVVPPAAVLEPVARDLPSLRERWPGLGWIPPERWHLTLSFLGEIPVPTVEAVAAGLSQVAAATPVMAALIGPGGTFPGGRRPRVAWVGVAAEGLPGLAELVADAAHGAGIAVDRRPYQPHVTMARVRREPVPDADGLRGALGAAAGGAFTIDRLVLMQSFLGPKPRYEEVASWALAGPE